MRNNLLIKPGVFFLFLFGVIVANSQTPKEEFETMAEALEHPRQATKVHIDYTAAVYTEFSKSIMRFAELEEIYITGARKEKQLEEVFYLLSRSPRLHKMVIELHSVTSIPENVKQLKKLEAIEVVPLRMDNSYKRGELLVEFASMHIDSKFLSIVFFSPTGELASDDFRKLADLSDNAIIESVSESYTPKDYTFLPYEKEYKNVAPPIEGVNVDKEMYRIKANKKNTIDYFTGTKISIPKDAFVDADGNVVDGQVQIDYREFHDQADVMISGIPMAYDSAGVSGNFETAGMFEILASQNGEELFLAEGKELEIDFASSSADSKYNFYAFNDTTGNWEYISKAGEEIKVEDYTNRTTIYSDAWKRYKNVVNRLPIIQEVDTTSFANRYSDSTYFATFNKNHYIYELIEKEAKLRKLKKETASNLTLGLVKNQKEGKQVWFNFGFDWKHYDLAAFGIMFWAVETDMTIKEFKGKYIDENIYSDTRITFNEEANNFTIELKGLNHFDTLVAVPRYTSDYTTERVEKRYGYYAKRYNKYRVLMENRFNKSVAKRYMINERNKLTKKRMLKKTWKGAKKLMSEEEKEMTMEEWLTYCDDLSTIYKKELKRKQTSIDALTSNYSTTVNRTLRVRRGLGIFNCDWIPPKPTRQTVLLPQYEYKNGKRYIPKQVYLINKKINGATTVKSNRFSVDPKGKNMIVTIDANNNVAVFDSEAFEKLGLTGEKGDEVQTVETDFVMQPINVDNDLAKLKKELGL